MSNISKWEMGTNGMGTLTSTEVAGAKLRGFMVYEHSWNLLGRQQVMSEVRIEVFLRAIFHCPILQLSKEYPDS